MAKVLKNLAREIPNNPGGRVRNYLARAELGSEQSTIHENIVNPGAVVPWHTHSCEEILVILEGLARCHTNDGAIDYEPGDVVIMPANEEHTIENIGEAPVRQLCFFPSANVVTTWRSSEVYEGQSLVLANETSSVSK